MKLAEVLVKNCGAELHQQVGSKHFMADLQSIATGEVSREVAREVVTVPAGGGWSGAAEVSRAHPSVGGSFQESAAGKNHLLPCHSLLTLRQTLPLFTATFNFLKAQGKEKEERYCMTRPAGVEFPQFDASLAPQLSGKVGDLAGVSADLLASRSTSTRVLGVHRTE